MDASNIELYYQIKMDIPYGDKYLDGEFDKDTKVNDLLIKWLKEEKPDTYRILNAQTLFIPVVEKFGRTWPPRVQYILHIAYSKTSNGTKRN